MNKGSIYNKNEIESISKSVIGKSFGDILSGKMISMHMVDSNKGSLGQLVEKCVFDMDLNS